jgi:hypothetical protein
MAVIFLTRSVLRLKQRRRHTQKGTAQGDHETASIHAMAHRLNTTSTPPAAHSLLVWNRHANRLEQLARRTARDCFATPEPILLHFRGDEAEKASFRQHLAPRPSAAGIALCA